MADAHVPDPPEPARRCPPHVIGAANAVLERRFVTWYHHDEHGDRVAKHREAQCDRCAVRVLFLPPKSKRPKGDGWTLRVEPAERVLREPAPVAG